MRKSGAGQDPVTALPSTSKASSPKYAFISAAKEFLAEMESIVQEIAEDTARTVKVEQKASLKTATALKTRLEGEICLTDCVLAMNV